MGIMFCGLDVLFVDMNKDINLLKLLDLICVIVKGIGINIFFMIKKIVELVGFFLFVI